MMREVAVSTKRSKSYSILIGPGLLAETGERVRALLPAASTAVIVTDDNVGPLYADAVRQSLQEVGLRVEVFTVPHGERSKSAESYIALTNQLARWRVTRSDVIVALGGGVVGDLAGFAAATWLRGVAFVQLPTTLLAAVDSSVGGKTAIDLETGKNLVGAFWQPRLVLCDTSTLNTLPEEIFRDGCAEVIKYAILYDRGLAAHLERHGLDFDREYVIELCVQMKRDVVNEDEHDFGARRFLNLGHTLAHAVETCSDYATSHGRAVAIGTAVIARASAVRGWCECPERIEALLRQFGLPTATAYSIDALTDVMLSDKKRESDAITLVIPEDFGACRLEKMPVGELKAFMNAGL